jgi:predicted TIM-barrel fold metal-dependent hydrolase
MFGSDYPHSESTFPNSLEIMSSRLDGVPAHERDMILFENVSRLYGFDLS